MAILRMLALVLGVILAPGPAWAQDALEVLPFLAPERDREGEYRLPIRSSRFSFRIERDAGGAAAGGLYFDVGSGVSFGARGRLGSGGPRALFALKLRF